RPKASAHVKHFDRSRRESLHLLALGAALSACVPPEEGQLPEQPKATQGAPEPQRSTEPDPSAQADEIIARNVAARGGLDKLRALRSLRLTGRARYGGGDGVLEATLAQAQTRSGKLRVEFTFQGITGVDG